MLEVKPTDQRGRTGHSPGGCTIDMPRETAIGRA